MKRVFRTTLSLLPLLLIGLLALSCGSDKGGGPVEPGPFNVMHLDFYNADALAPGYVYQAWGAEIDTSTTMAAAVGTWKKISAFRAVPSGSGGTATLFTLNDDPIAGNNITGIAGDLNDYDTILVTIEPASAIPATPTGSPYLGGRVPADLDKFVTASLDFPANITIGNSFFYLATPTDNDPNNDTSGVWFIKFGLPETAGLALLDAPAGWKYEGWVEHGGKWVSTGKFTSASGVDESDQYSGTDHNPPPFPGEDFLMGDATMPWVLTVTDSILITMEPEPDVNVNARFSIRLLGRDLSNPDPVNIGFNYPLPEWPVNTFANGIAVFKRADEL